MSEEHSKKVESSWKIQTTPDPNYLHSIHEDELSGLDTPQEAKPTNH